MPTKLFIDFESRSKLALSGPTGVGPHVYAEHPSTSILCMAWQADDWPVKVWRPGTSDDYGWEALLRDGATNIAHNCEFERALLRHKLGLETPIQRWSDTAARCARISLPRKLEDAAIALDLPVKKDMDGQRVMMKLAKPRRPSKANPDEWWTPEAKPEDFARLYAYCCDDVRAMVEVDRIVPELSPQERRVWELTIESNERGVPVDMAAVPRAQALADAIEEVLVAEFVALTGTSPNNPVKAALALGLPDFTEDTVRKALERDDLAPNVRRALEVRQLQAYSSLKKIEAFRARTSADGRLRGSLIYSGAERTQRWSGGGVQPQNFPAQVAIKNADELERAFEALHAGCLDLLYDDVLGTLSGMLRGFFLGPFLVGDYAQVEARNTAWLARQIDLVDAFAAGTDPYRQMAATIYGKDASLIVKLEREVGKRAILGCGYGMGADKFRSSLDKQYGIKVSAELAARTVSAYRRKYPRIKQLWYDLDDGFKRAIRGQHACIQVGRVEMGMTEIARKPFAYIRLPSGRALFYGWPRVDDDRVSYFGRNQYTTGWGTVDTWGGKITENIVQALSRDMLADAIIRMSDVGFDMAMTVHDELVVHGGLEDLERFREVFNRKPVWAETLAVGVECFATRRYRK
jgi:DNA polymerase